MRYLETTDDQANLFVNIITKSASSFFSITGKSKKEIKGWWSKDTKTARNDLKNAVTCQPKCSSQTQRGIFIKKGKLSDICKWSNGLVVKMLDSHSRGPMLKTTGWLQA